MLRLFILDGVIIEPGTYTEDELRSIVENAKSRGKKLDWDDFFAKQEAYERANTNPTILAIKDWANEHKEQIKQTILIIGGVTIVVTMVVVSGGIAAPFVGEQAAVMLGITNKVGEVAVWALAGGGTLVYTYLESGEIAEIWNGENFALNSWPINGDYARYQTV